MATDRLHQEVRLLRQRLAKLTDEAAKNEAILRRSQERELDLLHAEDLVTLFRRMHDGLADSFGLQRVTVVMCDPDHEVRHLLIATGHKPEQFPDLLFVDALTGLAPQYAALRRPWLGPYSAADHQLVFPGASGELASVAMIPLSRQLRLMGSVNFASGDRQRFTRHLATDFLSHLGVIASFALENTVNRARLLRSGFTDVLTGWHNRRYLQSRLREELARAQRHGNNLLCLMLDVDHFKRINDQHGHQAGDNVLRELAQRVEAQVRASDVAARYGGEEFVILLPDTDENSGLLLAERIRNAVSLSPVALGNGSAETLTVSIGIAAARPDAALADLKTAGDALLAQADVALYQAKSAGRDRVISA